MFRIPRRLCHSQGSSEFTSGPWVEGFSRSSSTKKYLVRGYMATAFLTGFMNAKNLIQEGENSPTWEIRQLAGGKLSHLMFARAVSKLYFLLYGTVLHGQYLPRLWRSTHTMQSENNTIFDKYRIF